MSDTPRCTDLTVTVQRNIRILCQLTHTSQIRSAVINQSIDQVYNVLPDEYEFTINKVGIHSEHNNKWEISCTLDSEDWSLEHFNNEDAVSYFKYHLDSEEVKFVIKIEEIDEVLQEIQDRIYTETSEFLSSKTQFDSSSINVETTSVYQDCDSDMKICDTRTTVLE